MKSMRPPFGSHLFTIRNKVAKVMFSHLSVILFTGGSASVHAGICPPRRRHPPDQAPCWEQTPPQDQTHPPGADPPPREQTPPRSRHPPGGDPPGTRHPSPDQALPGPGTPSPWQTATVADGTYPTGIHSC